MARILVLTVTLLLSSSRVIGDDKPPAPLPRADLDERIDKVLRGIINTGRALHNEGDPAGCYRLFQGSLMIIAPLLDHRPELKDGIEKGLKHAETLTDASDRAFALREVIDIVRSTLRKK